MLNLFKLKKGRIKRNEQLRCSTVGASRLTVGFLS